MPTFIETAIAIKAPPQRVWDVLTDFPKLGEWNPFIPAILGTAEIGRQLAVTIKPPGQRAMTLKPDVLVATPGRELRWRGRVLMPGIFDGEHYFIIEAEGAAGSTLRHGERFTGLLVPLVMRGNMLSATKAGFEAMNAALKKRAESGV